MRGVGGNCRIRDNSPTIIEETRIDGRLVKMRFSTVSLKPGFSRLASLPIVISICAFVLIGLFGGEKARSQDFRTYDSIVVGVRVDFPPYAYVNEYGRADGFSVDLLKQAAELMGLAIEIRMGPIQKLRESLYSHDIDLILGLEHTKENAAMANYGQPQTIVYDAIFYKKGEGVFSRITDLKNRHVVVLKDDIAYFYLLKHEITQNIRTAETAAEALKMVAGGKSEAALVPYQTGKSIVDNYNFAELTHSGELVTEYHRTLAFATAKGEKETLALIEQGVSLMRSSGSYDRLYEQWLGIGAEHTGYSPTIIRIAFITGTILATALAIILCWSMYLRRKNMRIARDLVKKLNENDRLTAELLRYRRNLDDMLLDRTSRLSEEANSQKEKSDELQMQISDLQSENEKLNRMGEIGNYGFWEYNLDRGTVCCDGIMRNIIGIESNLKNIPYPAFLNKFVPGDKARLKYILDHAVLNNRGLNCFVSVSGADGAVKTLELSGMAIDDGSGRVHRVEGTVHEVTPLFENIQEWMRSVIEISSLHDMLDFGIIRLDQDLTVAYVNPAGAKIFGRSVEDSVGKDFPDFILPAEIKEKFSDAILASLDNKAVRRLEFDLRREREKEWYEADIITAGEEIFVIVKPVSEVKRSNIELGYSLSLLDSVFELSTGPISVKSHDGKLLNANAAYAFMLGREIPEIIGRSEYELFDSESAREIRANDAEVIAKNLPQRFSETIKYNGTVIHLDSHKMPLATHTSDRVMILTVAENLTTRRLLDSELIRSNRIINSLCEIGVMPDGPHGQSRKDRERISSPEKFLRTCRVYNDLTTAPRINQTGIFLPPCCMVSGEGKRRLIIPFAADNCPFCNDSAQLINVEYPVENSEF